VESRFSSVGAETSSAYGEPEKPDWKEKKPEVEVEEQEGNEKLEQEPFHMVNIKALKPFPLTAPFL
jgi:hypothetical protein